MSNSNKSLRTMALKISAVVLVIILVLSICFFGLEIWEKHFGNFPEKNDALVETLSYNGDDYCLKDNVETMLLLGLDNQSNEDSGSYNNDRQADFILLLAIDNSDKSVKAIHINRDTMAEMNMLGVAGDKIGTIKKQIALSHTYGNGREVSCRNTANAVSKLLLGVNVDHYVSIVMDAVPTFNDLVGGVSVEILDDFSGIDDSLVKGSTVNLSGEQALKYVRTRYGLDDPTNNNRIKRQKQYIEALQKKTHDLIANDKSFVSKTSLAMADYIVSDCSGNKLETLFEKISSYEFEDSINIEGESKMGPQFVEFYPDEDALKAAVIECFYEIKK